MMKLSTQIVLTAGGLLAVSMGVLYPMQGRISELESTVEQLESESILNESVDMQLQVVRQQIDEFQAARASRGFALCPDNPESRHAFENALHECLQRAGLSRVSMDRKPGSPIGGIPTFVISLVVQGGAVSLHDFLRGIESLDWVTRVLRLEVQQGDLLKEGDDRRITMQIAVPLEKSS